MERFIHSAVTLGTGTEVGYNTIILENVQIGANCQIGHQVVIHPDTVIGDNVRIDDHATLGKRPMKAANSALTQEVELPPARIGDNCVIGTSAILYRGCTIGDHVLVADQASVREQSRVGDYTIIGRGVTVENRVEVGKRCKVEAGAYIAGPSEIGDDCFIAPEVTVTNDNFMGRTEERKKHFKGITLRDGGRIGANATLLPGRTIERDGVVAAGAVATQDVPARKIVAGVPAYPFRDVPEEQWIENQTPGNDASQKPRQVPLLDLKAQYACIKAEIKTAIDDVLESQHFILGPTVERFEGAAAAYVGAKHAVGVASGSDALLLSLMALDIGPGDEVITSPYTFFATAGAITRLGATPVFVDIDPYSYNLDPEGIEGRITRKTRAILPVHLFGQAADMAPILSLAARHDLFVVEDAAQALGAAYPTDGHWHSLGTMGHLGCYSFFPSKNLGAFGDGGMVVTNDDNLAEKLRTLRAHGASPKYHHQFVGCNSRLDALQAAVLSVKLKYLESWSCRRRGNAAAYDVGLAEKCLLKRELLQPPKKIYRNGTANHKDHIYNQYVVRAHDRDRLKAFLKDRGVASEIYYPIPLHLQACYRDLGYRPGDLPESERAAQQTLALPIYPELTPDQQRYIIDQIAVFYEQEA